jgi:hypothetical protein
MNEESRFMKFIMTLFLTTEDFSDVLVCKSKELVYKSEWKDIDAIFDLLNKWVSNEIPSTLSIHGMKFIKLHDSPFNLIFRSIQGSKALIGVKYPLKGEEVQVIAIVAQSSSMQLQSTALKDITHNIIELSQKSSGVTIIDDYKVQVNINLPENKKNVNLFISALKHMHFLCEYKDKGDALVFSFQYKKEEKKTYPDEVYKQYMKNNS